MNAGAAKIVPILRKVFRFRAAPLPSGARKLWKPKRAMHIPSLLVYHFKILKQHRHVIAEFIAKLCAFFGKKSFVAALPGFQSFILALPAANSICHFAERKDRYSRGADDAAWRAGPIRNDAVIAHFRKARPFRFKGEKTACRSAFFPGKDKCKQLVCKQLAQFKMKALRVSGGRPEACRNSCQN